MDADLNGFAGETPGEGGEGGAIFGRETAIQDMQAQSAPLRAMGTEAVKGDPETAEIGMVAGAGDGDWRLGNGRGQERPADIALKPFETEVGGCVGMAGAFGGLTGGRGLDKGLEIGEAFLWRVVDSQAVRAVKDLIRPATCGEGGGQATAAVEQGLDGLDAGAAPRHPAWRTSVSSSPSGHRAQRCGR